MWSRLLTVRAALGMRAFRSECNLEVRARREGESEREEVRTEGESVID